MRILTAYQSYFNCFTNFPSINTFFQHATIREHARLLEQIFSDTVSTPQKPVLHPLHIVEGKSCFCLISLFYQKKSVHLAHDSFFQKAQFL